MQSIRSTLWMCLRRKVPQMRRYVHCFWMTNFLECTTSISMRLLTCNWSGAVTTDSMRFRLTHRRIQVPFSNLTYRHFRRHRPLRYRNISPFSEDKIYDCAPVLVETTEAGAQSAFGLLKNGCECGLAKILGVAKMGYDIYICRFKNCVEKQV